MSDPNYVKLAKRLTNGMVADLESGWSIAGYDVKEFPEDSRQAQFVRGALNDSRLEAASTSEYELVEEERVGLAEFEAERLAAAGKVAPIQEHQIQDRHQASSRRVQEQRDEVDPDEHPFEATKARRAAVLEEQAALEGSGSGARRGGRRKATPAKEGAET